GFCPLLAPPGGQERAEGAKPGAQSRDLRLLILTPDFRLSTSAGRAAGPKSGTCATKRCTACPRGKRGSSRCARPQSPGTFASVRGARLPSPPAKFRLIP